MATMWDGQIWLRNSKTLTLAVGDANKTARSAQGSRENSVAARAFSVLIESEPKALSFVLPRFLYANRYPLRSKTP
jgi:hypothetical protein